jgi:hypothetical protein
MTVNKNPKTDKIRIKLNLQKVIKVPEKKFLIQCLMLSSEFKRLSLFTTYVVKTSLLVSGVGQIFKLT